MQDFGDLMVTVSTCAQKYCLICERDMSLFKEELHNRFNLIFHAREETVDKFPIVSQFWPILFATW